MQHAAALLHNPQRHMPLECMTLPELRSMLGDLKRQDEAKVAKAAEQAAAKQKKEAEAAAAKGKGKGAEDPRRKQLCKFVKKGERCERHAKKECPYSHQKLG